MTDPAPVAVKLEATPQRYGCTHCGRQQTVQLHPNNGRECPAHVTLPPGSFRSDLAADMVAMGYVSAAFGYLRAWLEAEIGRRFGEISHA